MLFVRNLVFAGALLVVVPFAAVAQDKAAPKQIPPSTGPAPAATAPAAPTTPAAPAVVNPGDCPPPATVKVCKMVPTMVEETRTVMKPVQKTETYTAHRTETVREVKTVPCTTYKTETYTEMVTKTHCVKVPVWSEKTVMEKRKKVEWVTEYKEKCKVVFDKEYKTIGGHGIFSKCKDKLTCGKCSKGDDCGNDGCDKGGITIPVHKPRIEKVIVPCKKAVCTWECVPVTKKCCTWKTEHKTECVPCVKTRCVPVHGTKEVVCCKQVCVPYQATRCVTVCEPVCEKVQVCKMVPTWVEEPACHNQAPATNACNDPCDNGGKFADKCGFGDKCEKVKSCFADKCESIKAKFADKCDKLKGCFGKCK